MTERKPSRFTFESWVDKQIRESQERGEFDDLPGLGKPLPGAGERVEELAWLKQKMRHEGLSAEALLPTSLRLRREIERLPDTLRRQPTESDAREVVEELNLRIARWLRAPTEPYVPVRLVDVEEAAAQWRAVREVVRQAPMPEPTAPKVRWWHRITGRSPGPR
jgi:hypothetical protein